MLNVTKKVAKVVKKVVDVSRIKSMIGEKQFNHEMVSAVQSGVPVTEAPELIARRRIRESQ